MSSSTVQVAKVSFTSTLESLIIVYTRNMFFDKISLLHAVIRALHDFRRGASRGAIFFFRPENF